MADTIFSKVKNAGKITEDATKKKAATPLTDLSANLGQNVPTDQLSASLMGANPDQTKMVGGQPQIRNAIQKNAQGAPEDLATQQRTAQPRKGANAEEQAKIDEQQRLAGLGSLDNRVQNIVNQKLDLQNKTMALEVDDSKLLGTLSEDQKTRVKELAMKVTAGTATPQDTAELNQLMGRDINSVLTQQEISGFLKTPEQIAQEQAAREVQDNITLQDISSEELGYNSYDELAADLGLPPEQMAGMSVSDLIAAVQSKQRTDFSSADRWRAVLADPTSSVNDKTEAQNMLREMGATGVREVSDDMKKLSSDVAASNTVEFGGETYTTEELLKDETVAGIAKQYFENPDAAARIKASSPGLAAFFDQHTKLFADATQHIGEEVAELNTAMTNRKKQIDTLKSIFGTDAAAVVPDITKVSTDDIQLPSFVTEPRLAQADKVGIGSLATNLRTMNPAFADRIIGLSYDDIKALGLNTEGGRQSFATFAAVQSNLNKSMAEVDPEQLITSIYGNPADLSHNLQALKAVGGGTDGILDANGDGIIDSQPEIAERLKRRYGGQDIVSGFLNSNPLGNAQTLQQRVAQYTDTNTPKGAIFAAYKNDGKLDQNEINGIADQYTNTRNIAGLKELTAMNPAFNSAWDHTTRLVADGMLKGMGADYDIETIQKKLFGNTDSMDIGLLEQMTNNLTNVTINGNKANYNPNTMSEIEQLRTMANGILQGKKAAKAKQEAEDKARQEAQMRAMMAAMSRTSRSPGRV